MEVKLDNNKDAKAKDSTAPKAIVLRKAHNFLF
jgi:hypothetical protein